MEGAAQTSSAAAPRLRWRLDVALAAAAFALALPAYLRTMRPTFGWGDSSELITAAYHLGVGHSPGYPTWMLVMHPFARLPIGDVAFRVNFATALLGAVGVALLYLVYALISRSRVAGFAAALAFAFSATFWDVTTEAEVYTLHVCLAALIVLLVLRWRREPADKWLYLLAWLVGISLGNHALIGLMVPAILYLVWAEKGWRFFGVRRVLACAGLFALGLSVYLYLPIRALANPPPHLNNPHGLLDFWYQVTAPGARQSMFDRGLVVALLRARHYLLFRPLLEFGYAACGLALAGIVLLARRDRRLAAFLGLIGLLDVAYSVNFSIFDIYVYYLPLYIALGAFLAVGAEGALRAGAAGVGWLVRGAVSPRPVMRYGPAAALLLTVPFGLFTGHIGWVDGSDDYGSERFARAVFEQVEPDAMILADWWSIAPLGYLKYIEGKRTDVTMFAAPSIYCEEGFVNFADDEFLHRYPTVYFVEMLTYRANLLRERYWLVPDGPVVRVYLDRPDPEGLLADIPAAPIARFGDRVGLVAVEREPAGILPGEVWGFTLYWTPLPGYEGQAYEAILVLENEEGGRIWQESNLLGHDLYPRERWEAGQVVREGHRVYLPEPVPPGEYELLVRVREHGKSACLPCDRAVDGKQGRDYLLCPVPVSEAERPSRAGRYPAVVAWLRP